MQLELAEKILKLAKRNGYMDVELCAGVVGVELGAVCQMVIEQADRFVGEDGKPLFTSIDELSQEAPGFNTLELAKKLLGLAYEYGYTLDDVELCACLVGIELGAVCQIILENSVEFVNGYGESMFPSVGMLKRDSYGLKPVVY
jgi:hypothetical protein